MIREGDKSKYCVDRMSEYYEPYIKYILCMHQIGLCWLVAINWTN